MHQTRALIILFLFVSIGISSPWSTICSCISTRNGAENGGAPRNSYLSVALIISDQNGTDIYDADVGQTVTIIANVSKAGGPSRLDDIFVKCQMKTYYDRIQYGDIAGPFSLDIAHPNVVVNWTWSPPGLEVYEFYVLAQVGNDSANATEAEHGLFSHGPDIIGSFTNISIPKPMYVGLDTLSFTVNVSNRGDRPGTINMTIWLDDTILLDSGIIGLQPDEFREISCATNLSGIGIANGNHKIIYRSADFLESMDIVTINPMTGLVLISFEVPAVVHARDNVSFKAVLLNNNPFPVDAVQVNFYDGNNQTGTLEWLNITAEGTAMAIENITIQEPANANHTYAVKTPGGILNQSRFVLPELNARIIIENFTARQTGIQVISDTTEAKTNLTLTLLNMGQNPGTVNISITASEGTLLRQKNVVIGGNAEINVTIVWKMKGFGSHTATARLEGPMADPKESVKTVKVRLSQEPCGVIQLIPLVIIPALLLVRKR